MIYGFDWQMAVVVFFVGVGGGTIAMALTDPTMIYEIGRFLLERQDKP